MAVNLLDVRGPVLVGLLHALTRLFLEDLEPGHDRLHPHRLRSAQEDVEGAGKVAQDVCAAPPDDHDVARACRLLDDMLRDLQDGLPRAEGGSGVGWGPRGRLW